MEQISPSDMKTILHSKRANMYYLEHCRVLVNDGRVEYVTNEGAQAKYMNIPIANTSFILLGTGTSITRDAAMYLCHAGVVYGFCGGGGSPLYSGTQVEIDIDWHLPQSEYRPTQYVHQWMKFWYTDDLRLEAAIHFQRVRLKMIEKHWLSSTMKRDAFFHCDAERLKNIVAKFEDQLIHVMSTQDILSLEANMTKSLYALAAQTTKHGDFTRIKRGLGTDTANQYLDHGNYLAYGLGTSATWVLGIPHAFSVLHGKTRRGGLVFDVADLVKDALVLPQAFIAAMAGETDQQFRQRCITQFHRADALDIMIDTLKDTAKKLSEANT